MSQLLDSKFHGVIGRIEEQYGVTVSFDTKRKDLRKYGRNIDLDTGGFEQVWVTGGIEVLPTDNTITHFASTSTGDVGTALKLEGHTIDGSGNKSFVSQEITLNGQNKTALPTPLARATRLYNDGATEFTGTVYVSKDVAYSVGVPASDIHITILPADQQTLKAATSMSSTDWFVITELGFSVNRSVSATVDFVLQVRKLNGVWRTQFRSTLSSSQSSIEYMFNVVEIVVPANADVRILAETSTNNTVVDAEMAGLLANTVRVL